MMWGYDNGVAWWGWLLMSLSMVVFWGLVIVGIFALVNWSGGRRDSGGDSREFRDTPEDTLARRLASGEIDQPTYRALRDELRGHPHGPSAAVR